MTNPLSSLNEIREFIQEYEHEHFAWHAPAKWFAALDGASDIIEKADSLHTAVDLAFKDHDICSTGLEDK